MWEQPSQTVPTGDGVVKLPHCAGVAYTPDTAKPPTSPDVVVIRPSGSTVGHCTRKSTGACGGAGGEGGGWGAPPTTWNREHVSNSFTLLYTCAAPFTCTSWLLYSGVAGVHWAGARAGGVGGMGASRLSTLLP